MLITLLLIAIVVLLIVFIQTKLEQAKLRKRFHKYDGLLNKEEFEEKLDLNINLKQVELDKLVRTQEKLKVQIRNLQQKLSEVEEDEYVQSFGFYKSKYNFDTSEKYKLQFNHIRERQKVMIKKNTAAICHVPWEVEGSKRKGEKMTNDFLKLLLRAFNGECDVAVAKVRYDNVKSLETRINKTFEALNKLSEVNRSEITREYLNLKLQELYLAHEFQEKKQEEREEQRRIQEQMREEQRALREIEKAKEEAEKEVKRREQALQQARQEVEQAVGKQKEKLEFKIQQLMQQLEEARANEQRAISRAQMTKSGHIYVVSNIGSFGYDVYKIGMTRRLDPNERVRELSGAAVPFPFDVHAIIFSENAPETENLLHQYLRDKSVNKVNERKEFFRVSLDEIASALEKIAKKTQSVNKAEIEFTKIAEAEQYRKTLAIERGETQPSESTYTPSWDEDEEEQEEDE
ncbi:hypothetical protein NIES4075_67130 [Tolypothrix sp. NIES-4075]|uniref:DUF4041 domain-containing protein n=1 Tax=Tolypothrix sp. NIES-4075 TaxID=2005459 RepID=UPI000B5C3185|nr:DUF4041 domain-containing protein [Tolypothrix sp. NIES-4075]GAX45692.1 hypothetical protein NIES4075_67130 [Tolypothrix sp. NIES-4075]